MLNRAVIVSEQVIYEPHNTTYNNGKVTIRRARFSTPSEERLSQYSNFPDVKIEEVSTLFAGREISGTQEEGARARERALGVSREAK